LELLTTEKDCCGCTACFHICPAKAIFMASDEEGFIYPNINKGKCIDCGLCKKVCAFKNQNSLNRNKNIGVYAVKHISDYVREKSTSGGFFSLISQRIIEKDGIIYGAGFDENMVVCHQRAVDKFQYEKFMGSKYVQSEMRDTLINIEADLRTGLLVLFTGTPCQAASVSSFLGIKKISLDNLLLCDIICHGVPNPKIFKDYLNLCQKKIGKKVVNHLFRSKENGWHSHTEKNVFEDGTEDCSSYFSQLYKSIFYSHLAMRPACHNCKYTSPDRVSDLTIADFWGIERVMPEFDDNKGVSCILINSVKGQIMFEELRDKMNYRISDIQSCQQPNLQQPTKPSPNREQFMVIYKTCGFEKAIRKYFSYGILGDTKRIISKVLDRLNLLSSAKRVFKR